MPRFPSNYDEFGRFRRESGGTSRQVDTDREDNFNAFVPSCRPGNVTRTPRRTRGSIDRYDSLDVLVVVPRSYGRVWLYRGYTEMRFNFIVDCRLVSSNRGVQFTCLARLVCSRMEILLRRVRLLKTFRRVLRAEKITWWTFSRIAVNVRVLFV